MGADKKFDKKMPVLESLFNKVVTLKACNFIKKWLQHMCFPVKFAKVATLKACNFIKKRLQHMCFPVKFAKFLRAVFLQNTSSGYSWII